MELKLKTISKDGIAEALSKVELYRCLNEPEEAESICHDVLVADPENQLAQRMLALTITDQFEGQSSDRYAEAENRRTCWSVPFRKRCGALKRRRKFGHSITTMQCCDGIGVCDCWRRSGRLRVRSRRPYLKTTTPLRLD